MLHINPKTQEEAFMMNLLEKGNYEFSVKKAEIKNSKAGNPMIALILDVYSQDGSIHGIFDYLLMDNQKLYKFLFSTGNGHMAKIGKIDVDKLKDAAGICKIYISEDKEGQYPPKNAVSDYLVNSSNANVNITKTKKDEPFVDSDLDKDCPF
jgi:hypothetical protein